MPAAPHPHRLDQRPGADRSAGGGDERGEGEARLAAAHIDLVSAGGLIHHAAWADLSLKLHPAR